MATGKEHKKRDDKPREASPEERHAGSNRGNMSAREARLAEGEVDRERYGRAENRTGAGASGNDQSRRRGDD